MGLKKMIDMWLCDSWLHPGQVARSYYFWFLKYNVLFQNTFFTVNMNTVLKNSKYYFVIKSFYFERLQSPGWLCDLSWCSESVFFTSLLSSAFLKTVSTDSRLHTRVVHSRTSAHLKHISALPCPLSFIRFFFYFWPYGSWWGLV